MLNLSINESKSIAKEMSIDGYRKKSKKKL